MKDFAKDFTLDNGSWVFTPNERELPDMSAYFHISPNNRKDSLIALLIDIDEEADEDEIDDLKMYELIYRAYRTDMAVEDFKQLLDDNMVRYKKNYTVFHPSGTVNNEKIKIVSQDSDELSMINIKKYFY